MVRPQPRHPVPPGYAQRAQAVGQPAAPVGHLRVRQRAVARDQGHRLGGRPGPAFDPRANAGVSCRAVRRHRESPMPPALPAGQPFGPARRRACPAGRADTVALSPAGNPLLTEAPPRVPRRLWAPPEAVGPPERNGRLVPAWSSRNRPRRRLRRSRRYGQAPGSSNGQAQLNPRSCTPLPWPAAPQVKIISGWVHEWPLIGAEGPAYGRAARRGPRPVLPRPTIQGPSKILSQRSCPLLGLVYLT